MVNGIKGQAGPFRIRLAVQPGVWTHLKGKDQT